MTDTLQPGTKAWHDRQSRHHHNSFLGHAKMMQANANSILQSTTATDEARAVAMKIYNLANDLYTELKTRR